MELKYRYQYFRLTVEQVDELKKGTDAETLCQLGCWYIYTVPTEDYVSRAAECFRRAIDLGSVEAKLHLGNMYRLGDFGHVDMSEYRRLLGGAIAGGCEKAEMRYCRDVAYGVGRRPNLDAGIAEGLRRLANHKNPSPEWFDMLGWMYVSKEVSDFEESNKFFQKAIERGYIDSYAGLVDVADSPIKGREEGCGDCCVTIADAYRKQYDYMLSEDASVVDIYTNDAEKQEFLSSNSEARANLAEQIVSLYEEAISLGAGSGCYYLGYIHYKGELNQPVDCQKAYEYFKRGAELANPVCFTMIADMIDNGDAPEQYKAEDSLLFRLKALRFGDDDQIVPVIQAYEDGKLDDYADEIITCHMPLYEALMDDICMNLDKDYETEGLEDWPDYDDDDMEDDDGRYDAWA